MDHPDDTAQMVSEETTAVASISLKIPPWFDDTDIWLQQLEAAFEVSRPRITSERTKYFHLVSNLPGHILKSIRDKMNPSSTSPYTELAETLRRRFSSSKSRIYDSIRNIKNENRNPFDLLCELRSRFKRLNTHSEDIVREAFINAMPDNIRSLIASLDRYVSLEELAERADNLIASNDTANKVMQVSSSVEKERIDLIMDKIDSLTEQVNKITFRASDGKQKYCFYHATFGKKARRLSATVRLEGFLKIILFQ